MNRRSFVRTTAAAAGTAAASGSAPLRVAAATEQSQASIRINGVRINGHLTELSKYGRNPQGGVSRVAYSDADREGRTYVQQLMRDAKLDVSIDTAGNIWGAGPAPRRGSSRS